MLEKILEPALLLIVTAAIGVGGNEWRKRAKSGTKRIEAEDTAQAGIMESLRGENAVLLLREREYLKTIQELRETIGKAQTRFEVMGMLASGDPQMVVQVAQDSAFVDLSRPLRPRPPHVPAASLSDPFAQLESQTLGRRKTDPQIVRGTLRLKNPK